ncbi:Stk1 family PASTA domain-containing Ser/Thr kinase [Brevibacillus fulvus]|uniref:Serine/threonine-protein kinase PrkC n=1 Tax=Brevibacillus fulvus TaxID=1125967 RepID=A0A938XS80_9BACL|nr:Stk1 family PASTA domain-containing Ser/Thr kinase [Brevibacillus fulvus]MBM7589403.1 serine/threonine-protein kinase [Brevibacillus fulvus]
MEIQRLGGRYQLEERIGGGGMAIVYRAKDLILNRPVAVKVLRPQYGYDEDFVNRFRREAQAVASLSHPNVVAVYDVGQDEDTHYMVMEYIEGSTLKDLINKYGALPVEEAVRIAVQVCDALDHAHQNKIIHRDIKPHNIMIGKNGRVKVTDFGIARAVTSATITHTNSVLGSVHYFSPEQARGGITAEKSDIYSLGIVLYEMVTGQLPFSGDSPISVALKHLQEPLPEPRTVNPRIPQSVENVILKALVKNPLLRYNSARDMLLDLETCLSPERRNEAKVTFPEEDEEQTRVYPAITEEMMRQAQFDRTGSRSQSYEEDEEPKPKKWWVKAMFWLVGAAAFVLLTIFGISMLNSLLEKPEINVPAVTGVEVELAVQQIRSANLVPQVIEQYNAAKEGTVFKQDPSPPLRAKENSTVLLYVSKGKQKVPMPSLVSLDRSNAENTLLQRGFTKENIHFEEQEDESVDPGKVMSQEPDAQVEVVPGETEVHLVISKQKEYVTMPDLSGKSLDEAKVVLYNAGLTAGEVTYEASYETDKADIVLSTRPYDPKMKVPAGMAVPLQVSNGQLPNDAKIGTTPVYIELVPGETAQIKITVSDARGKDQLFVDETISESKPYQVPLVLSPQKDGTVVVMKNGEQYQKFDIQYSSLP